MQDKKFPEGIVAYKPNPNAPEFIISNIVVTKEFIGYFNANHKQGQLQLQVKESKGGKYYIDINTYEKPTTVPEVKEQIREILNPNISQEEAEILAKHRAEHNRKVSQEDYSDEISVDEIPF